jgi:hypothetical protein
MEAQDLEKCLFWMDLGCVLGVLEITLRLFFKKRRTKLSTGLPKRALNPSKIDISLGPELLFFMSPSGCILAAFY